MQSLKTSLLEGNDPVSNKSGQILSYGVTLKHAKGNLDDYNNL